MKIVKKPWGYEKWIAITDRYVLKEIFMRTGFRSSLQYHKVKEETNYVLSGKGILHCGDGRLVLEKGVSFHIFPNEVHRVEAATDLTMIEASTPEVDDIVRVQDDYNRPNGRIENEHK